MWLLILSLDVLLNCTFPDERISWPISEKQSYILWHISHFALNTLTFAIIYDVIICVLRRRNILGGGLTVLTNWVVIQVFNCSRIIERGIQLYLLSLKIGMVHLVFYQESSNRRILTHLNNKLCDIKSTVKVLTWLKKNIAQDNLGIFVPKKSNMIKPVQFVILYYAYYTVYCILHTVYYLLCILMP